MAIFLRPLALGELLDRAFQLYRSRFKLFIGIAAVAYLPLFVVETGRLWMFGRLLHEVRWSSAAAMGVGLGALVTLVVRLLGVAAANAATIIAVSAAYLDRPINLREAYGRVSGMLVRVFFIMIGSGIGIGIGLLLFIVPGIILFLMWGLAIPVAVLEDAGLGDSLSRSRQLTAGHRGRVFVIYLLYFVLMAALEFGLVAPIAAVVAAKAGPAAFVGASPLFTVVTAAVGYLILCLITPILSISLSLMYYDERVRKEAFDIQLMMNALGEGPAGSAAATA